MARRRRELAETSRTGLAARTVASLPRGVPDSAGLRLPLGDAIETFIRREDAERLIEEVRGDEPELGSYLRIEERKLEAGGVN